MCRETDQIYFITNRSHINNYWNHNFQQGLLSADIYQDNIMVLHHSFTYCSHSARVKFCITTLFLWWRWSPHISGLFFLVDAGVLMDVNLSQTDDSSWEMMMMMIIPHFWSKCAKDELVYRLYCDHMLQFSSTFGCVWTFYTAVEQHTVTSIWVLMNTP